MYKQFTFIHKTALSPAARKRLLSGKNKVIGSNLLNNSSTFSGSLTFNISVTRCLTTSSSLFTNKNDGSKLDPESEIRSNHTKTKDDFKDYFEKKRDAVHEYYRVESNHVAANGGTQGEVDNVLDYRKGLL